MRFVYLVGLLVVALAACKARPVQEWPPDPAPCQCPSQEYYLKHVVIVVDEDATLHLNQTMDESWTMESVIIWSETPEGDEPQRRWRSLTQREIALQAVCEGWLRETLEQDYGDDAVPSDFMISEEGENG